MLRWRFVVGGEKLQIPFDFAQGRLSAALGMTKEGQRFHPEFVACGENRRALHFASVGMTTLLQGDSQESYEKSSSR